MVTMCVCYRISFKELKKYADQYNCKTIEELRKHIQFGENCKLCIPYINKMLETGETVFRVLNI